MVLVENKYTYFQDLEQLTKSGLVAYLMLMLSGLILAITGVDTILNFLLHIKICWALLIIMTTINILQIIVKGVNKIYWLGEVHTWLDKIFFRFVFKSNEIILRELLILLDPSERSIIDKLLKSERAGIARTIFSRLSDDQSIFETILQRGIFRSWIWYWITIYGVLIFLLLTITSFLVFLLAPSIYSKVFFVSIGIVAIIHIILSLITGYNLIFTTKKVMRDIVNFFYPEILSLLRNHIK